MFRRFASLFLCGIMITSAPVLVQASEERTVSVYMEEITDGELSDGSYLDGSPDISTEEPGSIQEGTQEAPAHSESISTPLDNTGSKTDEPADADEKPGKTDPAPSSAPANPTSTPTAIPASTSTETLTPTETPAPSVTPTPTPTPKPAVELAAPKITGCYNSVYGADLRWNRVQNAEAYAIYRHRSAEGTVLVDTVFGNDVLQYYDQSIQENCWGRVYAYHVVAIAGSAASPKSNEITLQRLAPLAFTGYTSAAAGSVSLQWNVSSGSNKAEGYELQYASSKTDLYNQTGSIKKISIPGRNNLSQTLTGLNKSTAYYFRIRAYVNYTHSVTKKTTKTWSQYSEVISVTPSGNATTKYRALLIGNYDYYGFSSDLYGPPNDVKAMGGMLKSYGYTITTKKNRTASQIFSDISNAFKSATVNDVSLFFYSGHGDEASGSLVGIDDSDIYMEELAARLKKVPGKVVIILDSCGSGNSIYKVGASGIEAETGSATEDPDTPAAVPAADDPNISAAPTTNNPDTFNQLVIDIFSQADPGLEPEAEGAELLSDGTSLPQVGLGELRVNKFYVLTASDAFQSSSDLYTSGQGWGGALSKGVVAAAGCSFPSGSYTGSIPGDTNKDRKLTLKELYVYSSDVVSWLTSRQRYPQTVRYYPVNSGQVILGKK